MREWKTSRRSRRWLGDESSCLVRKRTKSSHPWNPYKYWVKYGGPPVILASEGGDVNPPNKLTTDSFESFDWDPASKSKVKERTREKFQHRPLNSSHVCTLACAPADHTHVNTHVHTYIHSHKDMKRKHTSGKYIWLSLYQDGKIVANFANIMK